MEVNSEYHTRTAALVGRLTLDGQMNVIQIEMLHGQLGEVQARLAEALKELEELKTPPPEVVKATPPIVDEAPTEAPVSDFHPSDVARPAMVPTPQAS